MGHSTMATIRESWNSFETDVMPEDAPPVQRQEMRRAFFAGAWSILCELERLSHPSIPEAEGLDRLHWLRFECEAFKSRVGKDF